MNLGRGIGAYPKQPFRESQTRDLVYSGGIDFPGSLRQLSKLV